LPGRPPGPIRVLLVDDEAPARLALRTLLDEDADVELVGECANGADASASIRDLKPDLVFLDVQMPGLTGFEVIEALGGERGPAVIFVTAHAEHALRAFDVQAVDYLLKPFDDERFARALSRGKEAVRQRRALALAGHLAALLGASAGTAEAGGVAQGAWLERFTVRTNDGVRLVPVAEVEWIGAQDYYAEIHCGTRSWLVREPLRDLEHRLDPRQFVRIHRGAIVNLGFVGAIRTGARGADRVVLRDGTELPLSRGYRDGLRARLKAG
jgi:two-component system, LytTR family, response regulator